MSQPTNRRLVTEAALTEAVGGLVTEGELADALDGLAGGGAQLPDGGAAGQVLTKTAAGEAWLDAPTGIPSGGTAGQVLTKTATGETWSDAPSGGTGSAFLSGPGRPDQPGTTAGTITGSEPAGTTYTSTDGAGVGAWVWRKRPTGWTVVDGDTGWRDLSALCGPPLTAGTVRVRRDGPMVTWRFQGIATSGAGALFTVDHSHDLNAFMADDAWPPTMHTIPCPVWRAGQGGSPQWVTVERTTLAVRVHASGGISPGSTGTITIRTDAPFPTTLPGTAV